MKKSLQIHSMKCRSWIFLRPKKNTIIINRYRPSLILNSHVLPAEITAKSPPVLVDNKTYLNLSNRYKYKENMHSEWYHSENRFGRKLI